MTADQVIAAFRLSLREKQGVIANDVGGFDSEAYLEFYPHGLMEYTRASKTEMPTLTGRIRTAASSRLPVSGSEPDGHYEAGHG